MVEKVEAKYRQITMLTFFKRQNY